MDNTVLKQQDFADAAGTAITMLVERLSVHAEEWFVVPLSGFLKELCQKQRQGGIEPVFCVSISVLRTALLCGKPGSAWMHMDKTGLYMTDRLLPGL